MVVEFDPLYYSFRFYFPSCSFSSFLSFSSCYWYYYSHHHCLVRLIFTKNRNNRDHPTRFRLQYRPDRSVSLSCHTGSFRLSLRVVLVLVLVLILILVRPPTPHRDWTTPSAISMFLQYWECQSEQKDARCDQPSDCVVPPGTNRS